MKILVSAYACRRRYGSEQGVGWEWVKQISRFHRLWVLTSITNQAAVEEEPIENVTFVFVSVKGFSWLKKLGLIGHYIYYYIWHLSAYKQAVELNASARFDLAHQITFGTFRIPAFIAKLPIPFIWGPIGGGEYIPPRFWATLGYHAIGEMVRTLTNPIALWIPGVRASLRKAKMILVVNEDTLKFLPEKYRYKCRIMPIVGEYTVIAKQTVREERGKDNRIRLLFVGKLEPRRGLVLLFQALARLKHRVNFFLSVIGDGPELNRYKGISMSLGLGDDVAFVGRVPYEMVYEEYRKADVFCSSSLRDSGGSAYVGAMACGLPIICIDHAGPGELVTADCGIKVPLISRKQVVEDLATAIEDLARDAKVIKKMGEAGIMRVRKYFDWEVKTKILMGYYEEVGAGRN